MSPAMDGPSSPVDLQQRFQLHAGYGSGIWRALISANCPSADVSTLAAATAAYSQLLNFGLIRMTLPVPANAEFSIISITDPYQCPETTATQPALYRRPLPSTNLKFLKWDHVGRPGARTRKTQALDATLVHAAPPAPPTDAQLTPDREPRKLAVHRTVGRHSGRRSHRSGGERRFGVSLDPSLLSRDQLRAAGFDPNAFTLYTNWASASGSDGAAQQSVAREKVVQYIPPY